MFPNYTLTHCVHLTSNHCPLVLDTSFLAELLMHGRYKPRFNSYWLLEETCEDEVRHLWFDSDAPIPDRIRHVCASLSRWVRENSCFSKAEVVCLQRRLGELCDMAPDDAALEEIVVQKLRLNIEIDKEER